MSDNRDASNTSTRDAISLISEALTEAVTPVMAERMSLRLEAFSWTPVTVTTLLRSDTASLRAANALVTSEIWLANRAKVALATADFVAGVEDTRESRSDTPDAIFSNSDPNDDATEFALYLADQTRQAISDISDALIVAVTAVMALRKSLRLDAFS